MVYRGLATCKYNSATHALSREKVSLPIDTFSLLGSSQPISPPIRIHVVKKGYLDE